ncbi:MAG TPA: YdeI/OmpD-associated family protein [Pyrinomonadaceae bacterium]
MIKFSSTINKIGINPVVDPPEKVLIRIFDQAGKTSGPIAVHGKLNGAAFTQTLVKYRGVWRLYINGPMLKASGLKVGDKVTVEISFDPRPRDVKMHDQLIEALRREPVAKAEFDKLSPSRKKEISRYLNSLKTEASVERNIQRVLGHLRAEATDAQYGLMRRDRKTK